MQAISIWFLDWSRSHTRTPHTTFVDATPLSSSYGPKTPKKSNPGGSNYAEKDNQYQGYAQFLLKDVASKAPSVCLICEQARNLQEQNDDASCTGASLPMVQLAGKRSTRTLRVWMSQVLMGVKGPLRLTLRPSSETINCSDVRMASTISLESLRQPRQHNQAAAIS